MSNLLSVFPGSIDMGQDPVLLNHKFSIDFYLTQILLLIHFFWTLAAEEYLSGDYKPVAYESLTGILYQPLSRFF